MSECLEVQGALRAVKQAIMSNRVVKGYDIIPNPIYMVYWKRRTCFIS